MRRSLRDPQVRESILARVNQLAPSNVRRWGRVEFAQLLPHLASGLRTALGDRNVGGAPERRLLQRYATTPPAVLAATHPDFGLMRPRDWDVLQYRHLDHHLRQFSA